MPMEKLRSSEENRCDLILECFSKHQVLETYLKCGPWIGPCERRRQLLGSKRLE